MSVPIDRLYQYIESIANHAYGDVIIYRFWPHGSKNLENLKELRSNDWASAMINPCIVCHDQEPLDFDSYKDQDLASVHLPWMHSLLKKYDCYQPKHLKRATIFDKNILIHSEQQSKQVSRYQLDGFIPVYYWSHAMIALDWFRFAQHVDQQKNVRHKFLIYNRAWTGTREYRVKFADLLLEHDVLAYCDTKFNCVDTDSGLHYKDYEFENPDLRPSLILDNNFQPNTASSQYSADFEMADYESTDIEIVLETLFDDSRLHLTEKSLRPIACGQPFILAGTAGSLEYLKSYGFKTFDCVWDESYDTITDPLQRLNSIVQLMKEIASWSDATRHQKLQEANAIADYNKKHFFSSEFFDHVGRELATNLGQALKELIETNTSGNYLSQRKEICQHQELKSILTGKTKYPDHESLQSPMKETMFESRQIMKVLQSARQYYMRSLFKHN